jgi:hypothetical protein
MRTDSHRNWQGEAIRSGADPLQFTKDLEQLWIAADYPSALQDIGGLDEEVYVSEYMCHTLSETREMVRNHLLQFAESPDVP